MKYTHRTSKRSKHLAIKVEPPGEIVITSPPRISQKKIKEFYRKHEGWAQNKLAAMKKLQQRIESDQHLLIFGKKYQKKTISSSEHPTGIFIDNNHLIINFPHYNSSNKCQFAQAVKTEKNNFLKKAARKYFYLRVPQLAAQMQVKYNQIFVRNQKTRWGSCSGGKNINLNWRLVHWDRAVIDYLLIHELAHLQEANHSAQFWRLVAQHDPDYKQHRRFLHKFAVPLL